MVRLDSSLGFKPVLYHSQRTRPRKQFRKDSPDKRSDMQPAKNRARACQQRTEDHPQNEQRMQEEDGNSECRIETRSKNRCMHLWNFHRQILAGVRTISTEHLAWRATNSATLPSKKRWMALRPCEPTTIRSAPHSAAKSMILSLMSPTSTAASALNPALRSSFAIRSTNSRAGFV